MARDRQNPAPDRILSALANRVAALETRLSQVIDARRSPLFFSFSGSIADSVGLESMPMRPVHPTEIDLIVPQVRVAPSGTSITVDLTLYGTTTGVVRTLTIPSGALYSEDAVPFIIPMGGALTATVTGADGGAAQDLAIALIPKLL